MLEAADAVRAAAREQGCAEREVVRSRGARFRLERAAPRSRRAEPVLRAAPARIAPAHAASPARKATQAIDEFCADPPPDAVLLVHRAANGAGKHGGKWSEAIAHRACSCAVRDGARARTAGLAGAAPARARPARRHGAVQRAGRTRRGQPARRRAGNRQARAARRRHARSMPARMERSVADSARYDVFRPGRCRVERAACAGRAHAGRPAGRGRSGVRRCCGMVAMELQRAAALRACQGARRQPRRGIPRRSASGIRKQAAYTRALAAPRRRALGTLRRRSRARRPHRQGPRAPGDAWLRSSSACCSRSPIRRRGACSRRERDAGICLRRHVSIRCTTAISRSRARRATQSLAHVHLLPAADPPHKGAAARRCAATRGDAGTGDRRRTRACASTGRELRARRAVVHRRHAARTCARHVSATQPLAMARRRRPSCAAADLEAMARAVRARPRRGRRRDRAAGWSRGAAARRWPTPWRGRAGAAAGATARRRRRAGCCACASPCARNPPPMCAAASPPAATGARWCRRPWPRYIARPRPVRREPVRRTGASL